MKKYKWCDTCIANEWYPLKAPMHYKDKNFKKLIPAIKILVNTKIVYISDPKQGGNIKAADSNFDKDDINNALHEVIRWFITNQIE